MSIDLSKGLRFVANNAQETFQDAICLGSPSVTYYITPTSSTDPFSGKTNKYAESKLIAITTITQACHIKFGTSAITACTTSDYCIPANSTRYFVVNPETAYIRILENASAAKVFVTEVY